MPLYLNSELVINAWLCPSAPEAWRHSFTIFNLKLALLPRSQRQSARQFNGEPPRILSVEFTAIPLSLRDEITDGSWVSHGTIPQCLREKQEVLSFVSGQERISSYLKFEMSSKCFRIPGQEQMYDSKFKHTYTTTAFILSGTPRSSSTKPVIDCPSTKIGMLLT